MPRFLAVLLLVLLSGGCAPSPFAERWPELRPLGRDLPAYRPSLHATDDMPATYFPAPTGVVTLRQAMGAALLRNPELASFSYEVRVREARALQAGLPPNPEVGVEVENFAGTGATRSFDSAETTVSLSQLIELGDKRAMRVSVAELDRDLAGWDYEAKRVAVLTEVTRRFVNVITSQRRLDLAQQSMALTDQVFKAVGKRVDAGAAPAVERTRASVLVAVSQIEYQRAQRDLDESKIRLAEVWAQTSTQFDSVNGELQATTAIPPLETLTARISQNPDLARWAVELAQRRAAVDLAKANAVPNVTASAGVRRLNDSDDTALVVGLSLPLPLFDRNQGGIAEARFSQAKAEQERRAAEIRVGTALKVAHRSASTAYAETITLQEKVLPAAQEAFAGMDKAYQQGTVGLLEVLDAQRTLLEARKQHIDATGNYHAAVAELEGLIGQPLNFVEPATPNTDKPQN